MKYEIRANTKSYSEWSVDENGKLLFLEHEFEGHDIIEYKIIDIDDRAEVFESIETFQEAKDILKKLNEDLKIQKKA